MKLKAVCPLCGREYGEIIPPRCECGGSPSFIYDYSMVNPRAWKRRKPGLWRYRELLPPAKKIISLNEGGTPLFKAKLGEELSLNVHIKDETRNPTGSFRDRLASVAVSYGLTYAENGFIIASDGNGGASLAAYAARAEKEAFVVIPHKVDKGKLIQMIAFGARIIRYGESVDEAIPYASEISRLNGLYDVTPANNTLGIEGQKTLAFELWEELNPTHVLVPTGSGTLLYSLYRGFKELQLLGLVEEVPELIAVQTERCSPIAAALEGAKLKKEFTKALALYVREPSFLEKAVEAVRESGGKAVVVREEELDAGEKKLAREGVFAEYASAVVVPALMKLSEEGYFERDDRIVLLVTGSGLKSFQEERERSMISGTKLEILRILGEGEAYGYEIWERLEKPMKYQAVYQHIRELESLGLIEESRKKGRRIYYCLSPKGRRILENIEG